MVAFPKIFMNAFIQLRVRVAAAIAACFYFCVSPLASGQAPPIKTTVAQDLAKTFGFCYGQRLSLTQLRQMFPDLETQVMLAEMQWNSAFKEAEAGVRVPSKAFGPEQWEDTRAKMIAQF